MIDLKCPHCNYSGSNMLICKTCNTIFCSSCEKTLQGVEIKYGSTNECPVCKTLNNIYYVDYNNGSQR